MPHEKEVLIKMKKQFLTVGITMSMTASLMGCAGNSADSAETQRPAAAKPESPSVDAAAPGAVTASEGNSDVNTAYNILFITTDQEHYFAEDPAGTNWKARALLAEMGTTFEKHYACSNMSTSSRSVMFTGKHIIDTGIKKIQPRRTGFFYSVLKLFYFRSPGVHGICYLRQPYLPQA